MSRCKKGDNENFAGKTTKKKKRPGPIFIDRDMIKSSAFLSLKRRALQVLLIFLSKRQMGKVPIGKREAWVCINNGEIIFTYREAKEKYDITFGAFSRAITELVETGFLDITRPGIGYARVSTLYAVSDRWQDYGTEQFSEKKKIKRHAHKFAEKKHFPTTKSGY